MRALCIVDFRCPVDSVFPKRIINMSQLSRCRAYLFVINVSAAYFGQPLAWTQTKVASTDVYASVVDEKGRPLTGMTVVIGRAAGGALPTPSPVQLAVTDGKGAVRFSGLPLGVYRVCPSLSGSDLLNPCEWFTKPPLAVLTAQRPRADMPDIVMKRGKYVNIQITDPDGKLKDNGKGGRDHFVSVAVVSARGEHYASTVAEGNSGQSHILAVPIGVALRLNVQSLSLAVTGEGEAKDFNVNEGKTVTGASNGPTTPNSFQLAPNDGPKQLNYVVRLKDQK